MKTEPTEEQYLRGLLKLLETAKQYEQLTRTESSAWKAQPGSSLAGDDAQTNPYHLSHNVWTALSVSVDHLYCLRSSFVGEQKGNELPLTLHTHAQYTLLRGAFENSARAVWMLGPTKRLVRVQRRLSLQAGEHRHSDRMAAVLQQTPKRPLDVRMNQLTSLVISAGTDPADAKKVLAPPSYKDIVREAGNLTPMGADQAEAVWSGCSSLAHGDMYGTISILDREIMSTEGNVALTRITSDPKVLYWATDRTVTMLQRGFALLTQSAARLP